MKLFILLFLFLNLMAQDDYSFRVAYGKVTSSDLGEIISGDIQEHPDDLRVLAFDGGYLLGKEIYDLPIDIYARGGLAYFDEDNVQSDVLEATLYVKAYLNIDFLENRVRLGIGEGLSYTSDVLWSEYEEATREGDSYSQFLNYLDLSIDFDIGRLVRYDALKDTYIGWTIKHRSGVFGLFNGVHGGSNYNTISIEKNF